MYKEIEGDLISLAKSGEFDIIAHGCNCFCTMKRGIAPQMAKAFGCNEYLLEGYQYKGDINKLGQIDYVLSIPNYPKLKVINCYTQYHWDSKNKPFDYTAFALCLKKLNHIFKGKHIGLPMIGKGLAGGDWSKIKILIKAYLTDVEVTIVKLKN